MCGSIEAASAAIASLEDETLASKNGESAGIAAFAC
jgi:hypothetical protein